MKDLAERVLCADDIHDNSWDKEKAEYTLSMYDAALAACDSLLFFKEETAELIKILLTESWSESIEWAKSVLR